MVSIGRYDRGAVVAGLLFVVIGAGFFSDSFGIFRLNLVYVWPVTLIGLGASVLLGRAHRLEVEEVRTTQLTHAEERVRIAQELHDIVAHSVSLMTVQVGAARRVLSKKPEDAEKALLAAEKTGRESLAELRNIVSVLRSADASIEAAALRSEEGEEDAEMRPLPQLSDLDQLVSELSDAGLDVHLDIAGARPELSPGAELVIYRVVQEGLTNALRHAGMARVDVTIRYGPDMIDVAIEDNGSAAPEGRPQAGHGLVGMRERVAAVGGSVEFGPRPGGSGWFVLAKIPVRQNQ